MSEYSAASEVVFAKAGGGKLQRREAGLDNNTSLFFYLHTSLAAIDSDFAVHDHSGRHTSATAGRACLMRPPGHLPNARARVVTPPELKKSTARDKRVGSAACIDSDFTSTS